MVLQGVAHDFIELCKLLHYDKAVIHEGIYNMDETQKYYTKWKKTRSKKPSYSPSPTLQKVICDSVYMKYLELEDLIISREWGREVGRWLFNGYGAFFWKDENILVLEMMVAQYGECIEHLWIAHLKCLILCYTIFT